MTVTPEALNALTAALIAVIVSTLQWLVTSRFLPRVIEKQVSLAQAERQEELENQRKEREQHNALIAATIESVRRQQSQNDAIVEQNNALVKSVVSLVEVHAQTSAKVEGLGLALTANTRITTEGVEAVGELSDNVGVLLKEGSKPVQEIKAGVVELLKRTENITALTEAATQVKADRATVEKAITDLMAVATDLRMAVVLVQDHIRTLQRVKTGELPKLSSIIANEGDVNPQ